MAEITVLCEHLQAPSMCKDCRIARLEAEVAALKAQVERLSAPVSIREYLKYGIWEGMKISVNALITARKEAGND